MNFIRIYIILQYILSYPSLSYGILSYPIRLPDQMEIFSDLVSARNLPRLFVRQILFKLQDLKSNSIIKIAKICAKVKLSDHRTILPFTTLSIKNANDWYFLMI